MIINICKICKKEFARPTNPQRIYKYCSCACMGKDMEKTKKHSLAMKGHKAWNKGLKGIYSKETLESNRLKHLGISPPNKGKKMSEEQRKKLSDIKTGTHHSEITKKKISNFFLTHPEILKNRQVPKGEKHHNWKGGISKINDVIRHSIEGNLWRNSVFARDGYTCQKTGIKGGKLVAHHIQNFSSNTELRFAIDNGITLSEKSHKEFHHIYGKVRNTKEQMITYLSNK